MEVASPLTFGHVKAGSKRRLACSPLDTSATVDDYAMDDSASYGQSFKRRRCDNMEMSIAPQQAFAAANPFTPSGAKRQRSDDAQDATSRHLKSIIDRQSAEIRKIKCEKESVENAYKELSAISEKNQNENKVLKKVLVIKQERQDQFVAELENARRYKEQAEQLIAVLRQHIHAQQSHQNTGMGFNSGQPNVF